MSGIGVGIVGTGRSAEYHASAISASPSFSLRALLPRSPVRGREFATRHFIAAVYDDIEYMLEDPSVDMVVLSVPPEAALFYAIPVLRSGRMLVSERPMAPTFRDALLIGETAEREGMDWFCTSWLSSCPVFPSLKRALRDEDVEYEATLYGPRSLLSPPSFPLVHEALSALIFLFGDFSPGPSLFSFRHERARGRVRVEESANTGFSLCLSKSDGGCVEVEDGRVKVVQGFERKVLEELSLFSSRTLFRSHQYLGEWYESIASSISTGISCGASAERALSVLRYMEKKTHSQPCFTRIF